MGTELNDTRPAWHELPVMHRALAPIIDDPDTGDVLREACLTVADAYCACFPDDEFTEGWNVSDALDVLVDDGEPSAEVCEAIRLVRTVAS